MKSMLFALLVTLGAVAAQAHNPHHPHRPHPVPHGDLCATAYAYGYSSRLPIFDGARVSDLNEIGMRRDYGNDWDNKIDSVKVEPGCKLVAYQYQNYNIDYRTGVQLDGFRISLDNRDGAGVLIKHLNSHKNERISSLRCHCN
ncbi:hypothetical protein D3C87_1636690 [compost metagenome]